MILTVPSNQFLYPPQYGADPNLMVEIGLDGLPARGMGAICWDAGEGKTDCVSTDDSGAPIWNEAPGGNFPAGAGAGFDWSKLPAIINAAGAAANTAIRAGQNPALIPGTNTLYNPVTGTFATTSGVAAQAYGMSLLPVIGIAVVGVLLVVMMKK